MESNCFNSNFTKFKFTKSSLQNRADQDWTFQGRENQIERIKLTSFLMFHDYKKHKVVLRIEREVDLFRFSTVFMPPLTNVLLYSTLLYVGLWTFASGKKAFLTK